MTCKRMRNIEIMHKKMRKIEILRKGMRKLMRKMFVCFAFSLFIE